MSFKELQEVINARQFHKLVGETEGQHLDVKSQPYQFKTGMDAKRELAKDVAAFANTLGGYILVGLTTKISDVHAGEEIVAIRPIPRTEFDPDQYRKILAEWLYPQPNGLAITFVSYGTHANQGLGIAYVPPQDTANKPFLITRTIGDKKSTEVVLGYVERRIDATEAISVVELQQTLRVGFSLERQLLGRIESLELTIQKHFAAASETQSEAQRLTLIRNRIAQVLSHSSLKNRPVLVAYAVPIGVHELKSIFSDRPDSIRRQFENPPRVRNSGWGFGTGSRAQLIQGQRLRAESSREVIDLYRDGWLIFAGGITQNFLAWSDQQNARLHPLALIEALMNFSKFYRLVLNDLRAMPERLVVGLHLENLHLADKVHLPAGPVDPRWGTSFASRALEAPHDTGQFEVFTETSDYNPERIAFELTRELYGWFGYAEEDIPYSTGEGTGRRIDLEQILHVR
ncbi:MAG: ATP-binding protein [Bryobacteraceae bacterium]